MSLFILVIGAFILSFLIGKEHSWPEFSLFKPKEKTAEEHDAETKAACEAFRRVLLDLTHRILEQVPPDHILTLVRKRKLLRILDDYGNPQNSAWEGELDYYYETVLLPRFKQIALPLRADDPVSEAVEGLDDTYMNWRKEVLDYVDQVISQTRVEGTVEAPTDPYEYEVYCAEILETDGWNARRTSGSGDQGADVIADKDGTTVVIQCKLYGSPVGNKAVQEVTSARIFYGASHAVVVSNQGYTPSAKKLANATRVILMHHDDLASLPDKLAEVI